MKRLLISKNKITRVVINVAFIAIWEEFTGSMIEIIWETIDEIGFFNQDSFPILVIEMLFLVLPVLTCTYWISWGNGSIIKKIKSKLNYDLNIKWFFFI